MVRSTLLENTLTKGWLWNKEPYTEKRLDEFAQALTLLIGAAQVRVSLIKNLEKAAKSLATEQASHIVPTKNQTPTLMSQGALEQLAAAQERLASFTNNYIQQAYLLLGEDANVTAALTLVDSLQTKKHEREQQARNLHLLLETMAEQRRKIDAADEIHRTLEREMLLQFASDYDKLFAKYQFNHALPGANYIQMMVTEIKHEFEEGVKHLEEALKNIRLLQDKAPSHIEEARVAVVRKEMNEALKRLMRTKRTF